MHCFAIRLTHRRWPYVLFAGRFLPINSSFVVGRIAVCQLGDQYAECRLIIVIVRQSLLNIIDCWCVHRSLAQSHSHAQTVCHYRTNARRSNTDEQRLGSGALGAGIASSADRSLDIHAGRRPSTRYQVCLCLFPLIVVVRCKRIVGS
jgi:hypothetical protein